jgi:hypothetical protein
LFQDYEDVLRIYGVSNGKVYVLASFDIFMNGLPNIFVRYSPFTKIIRKIIGLITIYLELIKVIDVLYLN